MILALSIESSLSARNESVTELTFSFHDIERIPFVELDSIKYRRSTNRLRSPLSRLNELRSNGSVGWRLGPLRPRLHADAALAAYRIVNDGLLVVVFRSAKERSFAPRKATLYAVIPVIAGNE